jgi:hypothetical protein
MDRRAEHRAASRRERNAPKLSEPFAEYVAGRTIAIVGPGSLDGDQTPEIEAHDLVYVCSGQWRHHDVRADIVFLNSNYGRKYANHDLDLEYAPEWVVLKNAGSSRPQTRTAHQRKGININQVTGAVWDLSHYEPADVKVYGADFYLGGPGSSYQANYKTHAQTYNYQRTEESLRSHDQQGQRAIVRDVIAAKGWPTGDSRYVDIAMMPDKAYASAYNAVWRSPNAKAEWEAAP